MYPHSALQAYILWHFGKSICICIAVIIITLCVIVSDRVLRAIAIASGEEEFVKTPGVDPGQLGPVLPLVSVDSRKAGLQEFLDSHASLGGDFFRANSH